MRARGHLCLHICKIEFIRLIGAAAEKDRSCTYVGCLLACAMVQILLRLSEQTGEWGLVELQGQLETRHQAPLDNMHVGDLHFDLQVICMQQCQQQACEHQVLLMTVDCALRSSCRCEFLSLLSLCRELLFSSSDITC